ncbi:MAG: HAMP domain-containing histidine kinase [Oscillospiraceae bacterium]|nr:HAMP domain-containing histidine kinase [Oscillospiraceae bacterium]
MRNGRLHRLRLSLLLAVFVFAVMLLSMFLVLSVQFLLFRSHVMLRFELVPYIEFALASLLLGALLSVFLSRRSIGPLSEVMEATDKVAAGDYSVRVTPGGSEEIRMLGEKFNHMAQELGSVELLRSDFINNFSHEFKTPIVSISGFAKALKWDDLTEDERGEYLDIILEESERLSTLAENVLDLSRVENLTILTDKTRFNVSEQLRLAIALMDGKWRDKKIDFAFDGDEVFLEGSEPLLRQVWINLLDNAVKFSPEGGTVEVSVAQKGERTEIAVCDSGSGMTEEVRAHVFDKFYQGDASRTTKGNGLGLALVKRIVQLHGGTVEAQSREGGGARFAVTL